MLTMYCENENRKIVDLSGDGDSSETVLCGDGDTSNETVLCGGGDTSSETALCGASTIDLGHESDNSCKMALSDDANSIVKDLCQDSDDDSSQTALHGDGTIIIDLCHESDNKSSKVVLSDDDNTIDLCSDSDDDDSSKSTSHNPITVDLCSSRVDHPLNSQQRPIHWHSDTGMAETVRETSGSRTRSQSGGSVTSTDSGVVVEVPSDTDSSKTLSPADRGWSGTLGDGTDCSWSGDRSESHTGDPGLPITLTGADGKPDVFNPWNSQVAEALNETETYSHGHSLAQAVSEPDRTLCYSSGNNDDQSKSNINNLADVSLDRVEMTDSQLQDLVDSMFDQGFITRLEQEAKQLNSDQLPSQAASSSSTSSWGDPFYLPADQSVASTSVNMGGPAFTADYTTNKEDIELPFLMSEDDELGAVSLDWISASVTADPQFASLNMQSVLNAEYSVSPEISRDAAPPTHAGVDYDNGPEVFAKRDLTRSLSSSSPSASSSLSSWPFDNISEELEEARQVERLQVCEKNQAVLPDLLSQEERREYCQQEDCDKLVWEPRPTMDGPELTDYLEKAKEIKKEQAAMGAVPQSLFMTEDLTRALSALRHHDFNTEKSLAFLREQCQWQASPLFRWSDEECSAFVQGAKQYGKHFDKIQEMVKTRSHKEVVEYYYCWKRSKLDGTYRSKKTLMSLGTARYEKREDDLEDESSVDHSPWKRARRERSISPVRSLISSRHKTPPAIPEPEDRSSPTVTPTSPLVASTFPAVTAASPTATVTAASPSVTASSPTVTAAASTVPSSIFQAREQHSSSNLDDACDTEHSGDLDSSSDGRDLSHLVHLGCSDVTGVVETEAGGHYPNSPRSLGTPEPYPKSIQLCSDSSSDSSDTSSQSSSSNTSSSGCGRQSRKRRWSKLDDDTMHKFRDVLAQFQSQRKRHDLGTSSRGAARSDVYNSESESLDSDTSEEPSSSSRHTCS